MMSPETATRAQLLTLPAVTGIVGSRIFVAAAPQGVIAPFVVVQAISEITQGDHLRGSGQPWRSRLQVDAYARTTSGGDPYQTVTDLAWAIDGPGDGSGLAGWRGLHDPLLVRGMARMDRRPSFEPDAFGLVRWSLDYRMSWTWITLAGVMAAPFRSMR